MDGILILFRRLLSSFTGSVYGGSYSKYSVKVFSKFLWKFLLYGIHVLCVNLLPPMQCHVGEQRRLYTQSEMGHREWPVHTRSRGT